MFAPFLTEIDVYRGTGRDTSFSPRFALEPPSDQPCGGRCWPIVTGALALAGDRGHAPHFLPTSDEAFNGARYILAYGSIGQ
jgi:hypothetical protein